LLAGINIDTKLFLDVEPFSRHGTNSAASFLQRLGERHDLPETVFLVAGFGHRTAVSRQDWHGRVDYVERNTIEKLFHTLKTRVDRFHNPWVGGRSSVRPWLV
jgi:transposase-like protein